MTGMASRHRLQIDGCRVLVPWLRGYGRTRFLDPATPRSGQQAALGADVRDFMDALGIEQALLAGYDWGGRGACVARRCGRSACAAWCRSPATISRTLPPPGRPVAAAQEHRHWYQWYFHTERGRAGLQENRRDICRLLWRLWSPNWQFDDATFEATASSFDNPDFVDVTIQSYRHRYGNAPGDPVLDALEQRLAERPPITVPTIVLHGACDGVGPAEQSEATPGISPRATSGASCRSPGHFLSRETPDAVVQAVRDLLA